MCGQTESGLHILPWAFSLFICRGRGHQLPVDRALRSALTLIWPPHLTAFLLHTRLWLPPLHRLQPQRTRGALGGKISDTPIRPPANPQSRLSPRPWAGPGRWTSVPKQGSPTESQRCRNKDNNGATRAGRCGLTIHQSPLGLPLTAGLQEPALVQRSGLESEGSKGDKVVKKLVKTSDQCPK